MPQIITRSTTGIGVTVKGSPLTATEMDQNLISLNTEVHTDSYPAISPSLVLNFVASRSLDPRITFTRSSTATFFNSSGVLTTVGNNTPRLDYNPATLAARGLLIEEQRTNSIRNNTMQGAVAGTPGTLPTTWTTQLNGLTQTVVGTGTVNGISYIDIRFNGTTTSLGTIQVKPDGNASGTITATASQAWAMSSWVAIVGGSTANTTAQRLLVNEYSAGPTYLRTAAAATNILAGGATFTRVAGSITTGASTTILEPIIGLDHANGAAIDITLRIGLPQLELGAFATSVIPTTTTALTRSADVASVNALSPWFNATEGTMVAQYIRAGLTVSGGAAGFDDGTANNMIRFVFGTATPANQRFDVNTGGVSQAIILVNATGVVNTLYKDAGAYKLNDIAATENGAVVGVDTAATIPTVNILRLGTNPIGAYLNGWIQRFTYYPRRLPNADLQAITA